MNAKVLKLEQDGVWGAGLCWGEGSLLDLVIYKI